MRARACIKCKEYLVIHPNNPVNQVRLNLFEKAHYRHTLVIVNLDEIKGTYKPFKNGSKTSNEDYTSSLKKEYCFD